MNTEFEITEMPISSQEAGVFSKFTSQVRVQHLCLNGALSQEEAQLMVRMLNDINNSIYHVGERLNEEDGEALSEVVNG